MSTVVNRQWLLASRPEGMVEPSNFEWHEAPVPEPADGQLLVRNLAVSLDPAMRGWMSDMPSYLPPVGIGEVMRSGAVARVAESRDESFSEGDLVTGVFGWQDYAVVGGDAVQRVPADVTPEQALGVLGMTSLTAWAGLTLIGQPEAGETVVVSAAAGATGSIVGQIAKQRGCRAIGIAGGPEKCSWLVEEAGFDAAVDYKSEHVARRLGELAPDGIDVYFDNVGGAILEAALANIAMHGRVVICGAIASYNAEEPPPGPRNYMQLLVKRARMEGFLVFDHADRAGEALRELSGWLSEGKLRYREDVRDGLESAPASLVDLFTGANEGKLMVRVASA